MTPDTQVQTEVPPHKGRGVTMVPLSRIKWNFNVRTQLNWDTTDRLTSILNASGAHLEPIVINDDDDGIKGRHRFYSYGAIGRTEIPCFIVPKQPKSEEILSAVLDDINSATPITEPDLRLTIKQLIACKVPKKTIIERLGKHITEAYATKLVRDVSVSLESIRTQGAVDMVLKGHISTDEAARQTGVPAKAIKACLKARNQRNDTNITHAQSKLLGAQFRQLNVRIKKGFEIMFSNIETGDTSVTEVRKVLKHAVAMQHESMSKITNYVARFDKLNPDLAING